METIRYYREVEASELHLWDFNKDTIIAYIEPIEITEEENDLLYLNPISKEQQWKNIGYIRGKRAILSKLKGDG